MLVICSCKEEAPYLLFDPPYLDFPAEGGSATIYVSSNTQWNCSNPDPYSELGGYWSGYGSGGGETFRITVQPNLNQTPIEGIFEFTMYDPRDGNWCTAGQVHVTVAAANGNNNNGSSEVIAPSNLQAQTSGTNVNLSWTYNGYAEQFYVYASSSSYGEYEYIDYVVGDYRSCLIEVQSSGTYYFKITAISNGIESAFSNTASATISSSGSGGSGGSEQPSKPSAPTNVKATISGESIIVSWNAVSGAEYYQVYYVAPYPYDIESFENTHSTSMTFYPKTKVGTWKFWVKAVNSNYDMSNASSIVTVNYTSGGGSNSGGGGSTQSQLETPKNLDYASDTYYVQISFDEVPLAYEYHLYRSTSPSSGYSKITASGGSISGGRYVLTDQSPKSGTTYYKVKAIALSSLGMKDSELSSYIKVTR